MNYANAYDIIIPMPEEPVPQPASIPLEQDRFTSLINSMADGVISLDGDCRVALYNASALNLLDLNVNIQGVQLGGVMKLFDNKNEPVDVDGLIKRSKITATYQDFLMHYPDGGKANIYLNISPVHEGYGQTDSNGFILVMRDITREKSLEEERDEFISVASHELRTPIAITEGNIANAQFIADKTGDLEQVKKAMNNAHTQVLFLADMINDLAALSRAERGKLGAEIKPINVHDLVQQLTTTYGPQAAEKNLEIKTEIDPKLELLNSAELYVKEVLQNFITNSIKYTQAGHITRCQARSSRYSVLCLRHWHRH